MQTQNMAFYESLVQRKIINTPEETQKVIKKYGDDLKKFALEAFKDHEIMSEATDRWKIAKRYPDGKWTNIYLAEIVALRNGLLVCGDIDPVIFEDGGGESPKGLVDWVATSHISGYLVTKAAMGFRSSGNRNPAETTDNSVAEAEMQRQVFDRYTEICEGVIADIEFEEMSSDKIKLTKDRQIECDDETLKKQVLSKINEELEKDDIIKAWDKAITDLTCYGEPLELVKNVLYEDLNDAGVSDVCEILSDIGVVPATRLYYAQAACKKLNEILIAREEITNAKAI